MKEKNNLPEYYSYVATFSKDDDGWLVEFPDLARCKTNADTLEEAVLQANNILEDYMAILERDSIKIPKATAFEKIKTPINGEKQRIVVPMKNARLRWQNKTVKRTITLPAWLDQKAQEAGINFSKIIQVALLQQGL